MKKFIILFFFSLCLSGINVNALEIENNDILVEKLENVEIEITKIEEREEVLTNEITELEGNYEVAYQVYCEKIKTLCSVSSALSDNVIYDLFTKASIIELISNDDTDNPNNIQIEIDTKKDELKLLYFQKESYKKLKEQIESSVDDYNEKYDDEFNPIWPVPGFGLGWVTCVFGNGHFGYDIAAYQGTEIVAVQSGTVVSSEYHNSWGNNVLIYHNEEYSTRYAHMYEMYVSVGDYVEQGQVIGVVGSTGNSTGNHLHYEVYYNGERVDPYVFF
ncbi:MAG: peptidoglycan DD-metalloendopeptidase family protein [Clostridia bacterium]